MTGRRSVPTILVSGFAPFGGDVRNPSGEIARSLHGRVVGRVNAAIVGVELPVRAGIAALLIEQASALADLAAIVALGVDSSRREPGLAIETVSHNLYVDRAGAPPEPIDDGPDRRSLAWSVAPWLAALADAAVVARASTDAGRYVCNDTLHRLLARAVHPHSVFMHLPRVREMGRPGDEAAPTLASVTADVTTALGALADLVA